VVEAAAADWATDAHLIFADGVVAPESGESFIWFFSFYSKSLDLFNAFMLFNDTVVQTGQSSEEFADTAGVRVDWIDSDEAAFRAFENGGGDFLAQNENVESSAFLGFPSERGGDEEVVARTSAGGKWGHEVFTKVSGLGKTAANGSQGPVWFINYFSRNTFQGILVALDAETGEPVVLGLTTATNNLDLAKQVASNWANDAQLINIQSYGLTADGLNQQWQYGFFSVTRDSVRRIITFQNQIVDEITESKFFHPSLEPLPQNWIDSPTAAAVADANSNNFRSLYPDTFVDGYLSRNLFIDNRPVWRIHYSSGGSQQSLEVYIDALSGQNITGVDDGSPTVPGVFELAQNYPNPFNPETVIRYSLAKTGAVELAVYNLLGQKVRVLVDKMQTVGSHDIKWDGRDDLGNRLASGVYIYRLQTAEFTQTKKMILLQ